MRFCGGCGQALAAGFGAAEAPSPVERRHLSVLFCELELSGPAGELDPGAHQALVVRLHQLCRGPVERFEGHVAKYLDGGILAHFGYPVAHEDDALRAVLAGLEIVESVSRVDLGRGGDQDPARSIRVGIHSGLEVVGDVEAGERWRQLAVGQTHNLASRLKDAAEPLTVYISEETCRLVRGAVGLEDVGPLPLKGLDEPVEVFRALGAARAPTRFRATAGSRPTPLVGRREQLEILEGVWRRAAAGEASALALVGEAGLGKSRLVEALRERLMGSAQQTVELQCSPYYRNTALHPVSDMLERWIGLPRDAANERRLLRLKRAMAAVGLDPREAVPLLAPLLSLQLSPDLEPHGLTPERLRRALQDLLIRWLELMSRRAPVLLVVEDLHWADPSSLGLLEAWMGTHRSVPVLTLLTYRPRETGWTPPVGVRELALGRLQRVEIEAMLRLLAGPDALGEAVLSELAEKADGVPLYIEELTRAVLDDPSATGPGRTASSLPIPARLHDSLLARLDRLGSAKEVAQLGATVGREFDLETLCDVSYLDRAVIAHDLEQLVEAGVLVTTGGGGGNYMFHHMLLQDAAYHSLPARQRQAYHRQIAQSIEARLPDVAAARPELLARHYAEARLPHKAVPYWERAGHRAMESHALVEAKRHLQGGLEALRAVPESPERDRTELGLLAALGPSVMATEGFGAPAVARIYRRAEELSSRAEHTIELFPVLFGIHRYHSLCGHRRDAQRLGDRVLDLADRQGSRAHVLVARQALSVTFFHMGQFGDAREHLERAAALLDQDPEVPRAFLYGLHPAVGCHCYLGYTLLFTGYPDQARPRIHRALEVARTLRDPLNVAFMLCGSAFVHQLLDQPREVLTFTDEALDVARDGGFPTAVAWSLLLQGWARSRLGDPTGLELLARGLDDWVATGLRANLTHSLGTAAETYLSRGRGAEAWALLEQADSLMEETGERFYESGLCRIRADVLLLDEASRRSEALHWYRRALGLARDQEARHLELQAAVALVRSGLDPTAGASALASALAGLSEGWDLDPVREAGNLLASLR